MCFNRFLIDFKLQMDTTTALRYLVDSARGFPSRLKRPRSAPGTSSRSLSGLDMGPRAMRCVLINSSPIFSLIWPLKVLTYTCQAVSEVENLNFRPIGLNLHKLC